MRECCFYFLGWYLLIARKFRINLMWCLRLYWNCLMACTSYMMQSHWKDHRDFWKGDNRSGFPLCFLLPFVHVCGSKWPHSNKWNECISAHWALIKKLESYVIQHHAPHRWASGHNETDSNDTIGDITAMGILLSISQSDWANARKYDQSSNDQFFYFSISFRHHSWTTVTDIFCR